MRMFAVAAVLAMGLQFGSPAFADACKPIADKGQSTGLNFGADTQKATLTGAALGGLVGGLVGNNTGNGNAETGALVGASIGAIAGFAAGNVASKRRKAFGTESAYLDCEIETAQGLIERKNEQLAAAEDELASLEIEVDAVLAQLANDQSDIAALTDLKQRLDDKIAQQNSELQVAQMELDYFDDVLSRKKSSKKEDPAALEVRREQLSNERAALLVRYEELARINQNTIIAASKLPSQG